MAKRGRPKGSTSDYTMSEAARTQRMTAALKDGKQSAIFKTIIDNEDESGELSEQLKEAKIQAWKEIGHSPIMFISQRIVELDSYFKVLLANGKIDPAEARRYYDTLLKHGEKIAKFKEATADTKLKASMVKQFYREDQEFDIDMTMDDSDEEEDE